MLSQWTKVSHRAVAPGRVVAREAFRAVGTLAIALESGLSGSKG